MTNNKNIIEQIYVNALQGKGVHIITSSEETAREYEKEMEKKINSLGLTARHNL